MIKKTRKLKEPYEVADELHNYFQTACSEMALDNSNGGDMFKDGTTADDLFDDSDMCQDLLGDRIHEECSIGGFKINVERALAILDELERLMPHQTMALNSLEESFKKQGKR